MAVMQVLELEVMSVGTFLYVYGAWVSLLFW